MITRFSTREKGVKELKVLLECKLDILPSNGTAIIMPDNKRYIVQGKLFYLNWKKPYTEIFIVQKNLPE